MSNADFHHEAAIADEGLSTASPLIENANGVISVMSGYRVILSISKGGDAPSEGTGWLYKNRWLHSLVLYEREKFKAGRMSTRAAAREYWPQAEAPSYSVYYMSAFCSSVKSSSWRNNVRMPESVKAPQMSSSPMAGFCRHAINLSEIITKMCQLYRNGPSPGVEQKHERKWRYALSTRHHRPLKYALYVGKIACGAAYKASRQYFSRACYFVAAGAVLLSR